MGRQLCVGATELTALPQQITDAHAALAEKRKRVLLLGQRSTLEDSQEALRLHGEIAEEQCVLDAKRAKLKELSKKASKASADQGRSGQLQLTLSETTELVPTVSAENMPLPAAQVERVQSLAEQLNNLASFERSATCIPPVD